MNTSIQFGSLSELPQQLVSYLLSSPVSSFNNGLLANYQLSADKRPILVRAEADLVFRKLLIEDLLSALRERLQLSDDVAARAIVQDIYNEFCGPVRWYFPDLAERLKKIGFEFVENDLFPVAQPKASSAEAVRLLLEKLGDTPRTVKEKIETIAKTVIRDQQFDEASMRALLIKSVTDGGIGLGENNSQTVLALLKEFVTLYSFTDVPDKHEIMVAKKPTPSTVDPATLAQDVLAPHESEDLVEASVAASAVAESALSAHQQSLVEAVLVAESLQDRSEEMQKRWRTIVEARIGGARDAVKTRAMLETPEMGGGLGLSAAEASRLADLLEQTASGFEKRREEFSVIEKIASMKQQAEGIMAGPEAGDRNTQKQLNERFVSLFGKGAVEEMRRETHREIESPEIAHPGEAARSHVAPFNLNPVPATPQPTQQLPVAQNIVTPVEAIQPEPKYVPKVPDKLRMLIDAEKPIFPLKSQTNPLPQKKSADIRPSMKLIGPVDELRTMSMIDFRRLSPDVSVRIQKIRSKIEVIAEDGPHEKIRAIQAFEQSDPVRLYREILKRSLIEQRGAEELSADYKTQKKEYLEPEEIIALRQFLTQIRYSSL